MLFVPKLELLLLKGFSWLKIWPVTCKNRNISTSNLSLDLPPDFLKDNCPPNPLQSCDDFNKILNNVEEGVVINENKISDNKKNPEEENVINKNKVPEHKENSEKEIKIKFHMTKKNKNKIKMNK